MDERVSKYSRRDAAAGLATIVFHLTEMALMWFENHDKTPTTGSMRRVNQEVLWRFRSETSDSRGDTAAESVSARGNMHTYIEEMRKLCRVVDARIPEDDKV